MMNESKRLKEVWKWKEDVFTKTRDMSKDESKLYFNEGLENFIKKTGLKLKVIRREEAQLSDSKS